MFSHTSAALSSFIGKDSKAEDLGSPQSDTTLRRHALGDLHILALQKATL